MNCTTFGFVARARAWASMASACTSWGRKCPVIAWKIANAPLPISAAPVSSRGKLPSPSRASKRPRSFATDSPAEGLLQLGKTRLQVFRQHTGLGHAGHEVHVAAPARKDVQMDVPGHTGPR